MICAAILQAQPSHGRSPASRAGAPASLPTEQQQQQQMDQRREEALQRQRHLAALNALRTCSEDGGDLPVIGGTCESSVGTDDIIGNVDWALGDASEDDMAIYG